MRLLIIFTLIVLNSGCTFYDYSLEEDGVIVKGHVLDKINGKPLKDAKVTFFWVHEDISGFGSTTSISCSGSTNNKGEYLIFAESLPYMGYNTFYYTIMCKGYHSISTDTLLTTVNDFLLIKK